MSMRAKIKEDWLNNSNDPSEVANAKLAIHVMELMQTMHLQLRFQLKNTSGFGELFGPAFLQCPKELKLAYSSLLRSTLDSTEADLAKSLVDYAEDQDLDQTELKPWPLYMKRQASAAVYSAVVDDLNLPDDESGCIDEETEVLIKRKQNKKEKISMLIFGPRGHEWIVDMLQKPSPASRRLFAAAHRVLVDFVKEGEVNTRELCGNNIELLTQVLELNQVEKRILELADAILRASVKIDLFNYIEHRRQIRQALASLCKCDAKQLKNAIDPKGKLRCSGIFVEIVGDGDLDDVFTLSNLGQDLLSHPFVTVAEMAHSVLKPLNTAITQTLEWPHLHTETTLLLSALKTALKNKSEGINIMLHGAPGTGKTEFARHLCAQLACPAYLIATTDEDGEEAQREERINNLRLCQRLAGQSGQVVLVLDEAEDIFPNEHASLFGLRITGNPAQLLFYSCETS